MNEIDIVPSVFKSLREHLGYLMERENVLPFSDSVKQRGNMEVRGLSNDENLVKSGDIFFCHQEMQNCNPDIAFRLFEQGVLVLIVSMRAQGIFRVPEGFPVVFVSDTRIAEGILVNFFWDFPSRSLMLVGVTGTNGKTTTTYMLRSIFEAAGLKSGLLGGVQYDVPGEKPLEASLTTPPALILVPLLEKIRRSGVKWGFMEATSHAAALHRLYHVDLVALGLTNVSRDHLDFHKDMRHYIQSKKSFLSLLKDSQSIATKRFFLNVDDACYDEFRQEAVRLDLQCHSFGMKEGAEYQVLRDSISLKPDGRCFSVRTIQGKKMDLAISSLGLFNVWNGALACAMASELGIESVHIVQGLRNVQVPGRFEPTRLLNGALVIVDFAHTPDALKNALISVLQLKPNKVICVFGCGGDRDQGKRPMMGAVAAQYADVVILTNDNPRSEDPDNIFRDICSGISNNVPLTIADRPEAIQVALKMAKCGDVVLIAGKGHEKYVVFSGKGERMVVDDTGYVRNVQSIDT